MSRFIEGDARTHSLLFPEPYFIANFVSI